MPAVAIRPMKQSYGTLSYNPENKDAFLRDGKRFMTAVGKYLESCFPGIKTKATINEGGIAVSGEVYFDVRVTDTQGLLVTVTEASFSTKPIAYAQIRAARPGEANPKHLGQIVGDNIHLDLFNVDRMVQVLSRHIHAIKTGNAA